MNDRPALEVDDLRITFTTGEGDERRVDEVVHGIGFAVPRGQVLALVGESGSGKSVTAMATLGLLPGSARATGSVRIDGEEMLGAPAERLRAIRGRAVGTIFQEPTGALNPVFTIGDQIEEAIWAHHPELTRPERRRRTIELLGLVEVDDPRRIARSYPHQTSGGQLQRAMIAMAISNDPALLIADEPTTALDVTVQAGILDLLRDLTRRIDSAVLLITHDMGVVADVADEVAVMERGVIVENAPTARLFAEPRHDYTRRLLAAVPELGATATVTGASNAGPPTDPALPAAELVDARVTFRGRSGTTTALDRVSLRIEPGEFVGLVGESGSGKSTLGRTLSGLVPLDEGRALLAGVDVGTARGAGLRRARSHLGLVFQDPASSLNPRHTVGRSIADPLRLHTDLDQSGRRGRVLDLLDAVRLDPALADRYPHELSGGQRQRVAIARALSCRPELLIADEPTSALDVSVQQQILDLLRRLQVEFGFACLFISHDLAVVGELTTRVAVLRHGRLVEEGPTAQVLSEPADAYTRRLLAAVPVPDPARQAERRSRWRALTDAS